MDSIPVPGAIDEPKGKKIRFFFNLVDSGWIFLGSNRTAVAPCTARETNLEANGAVVVVVAVVAVVDSDGTI